MTPTDAGAAGAPEAVYYLSKDSRVFGPHSAADIGSFLQRGMLSREDLLWTEGMAEWIPVRDVVEASPETPDAGAPVEMLLQPAHDDAPIWARPAPDRLTPRLSVGVVTALLLHGLLLVTLTIGAPIFFKLNADMPEPQAGEPAPLEVSMVEIPDEAPPAVRQEVPVPPPPPPAPPETPIPVPPVPPAPTPVDTPPAPPAPASVETPQAVLAPPPVIESPSPRALPVLKAVPVALPVARGSSDSGPALAPAVDAGPSDYLYAPPPPYPYEARQNREEGTVLLRVTIDNAGVPVSITVDKSSGYSILDRVAQNGVEKFRFRVGSNRVFRVPITFEEEK